MPLFKFNTISRTDIESSIGGSQMLRAIDYDGPYHLLITGCPGSGKTTISIMRAQRLAIANKNVLVITYQDLLKTSLTNIANNLSNRIFKFYSWYYKQTGKKVDHKSETEMIAELESTLNYDEIIIDEGQDFEARIFRTLLKKCNRLTVGADNAQKVHARGLKSDEIHNEIKKHKELQPVNLQYNYRNTYEIYNFARHFLPFNERANNNISINKIPKGNGNMPTAFLVPDENTCLHQLKILLENAGDRNIAILVYLTDEVDYYYDKIREMGFRCTKHHHDAHAADDIENILITTYKSAKGLEFQVVIMPNMETAMNEEYKTEEHYYIGCTRAKESLFLIFNGLELPVYFRKFEKSSYTFAPVEKRSRLSTSEASSEADDLPF